MQPNFEAVESKSGIYRIYRIDGYERGKPHQHEWYGQARDIAKRWRHHLMFFKSGTNSAILQRAWEKYGPDAFAWELVEEVPCTNEGLNAREQWYLDTYKPLYNIAKIAGSVRGIKRTLEQRAAIKARFWSNLDNLKHLREYAAPPASPERMAELNRLSADKRRGVPLSATHRARIGKGLKELRIYTPHMLRGLYRTHAQRRGGHHSEIHRQMLKAAWEERRNRPTVSYDPDTTPQYFLQPAVNAPAIFQWMETQGWGNALRVNTMEAARLIGPQIGLSPETTHRNLKTMAYQGLITENLDKSALQKGLDVGHELQRQKLLANIATVREALNQLGWRGNVPVGRWQASENIASISGLTQVVVYRIIPLLEQEGYVSFARRPKARRTTKSPTEAQKQASARNLANAHNPEAYRKAAETRHNRPRTEKEKAADQAKIGQALNERQQAALAEGRKLGTEASANVRRNNEAPPGSLAALRSATQARHQAALEGTYQLTPAQITANDARRGRGWSEARRAAQRRKQSHSNQLPLFPDAQDC